MSDAVEKKEYVIWCPDIQGLSAYVRVWETLKELTKRHYAGPTIEQIVEVTSISTELVEGVLGRLSSRHSDNCVEVAFCQEGTSGPFATRFKQREGQIPNFTLAYNATYKICMRQEH